MCAVVMYPTSISVPTRDACAQVVNIPSDFAWFGMPTISVLCSEVYRRCATYAVDDLGAPALLFIIIAQVSAVLHAKVIRPSSSSVHP